MGEIAGGKGDTRQSWGKGGKLGQCNSIINKIYFLKKESIEGLLFNKANFKKYRAIIRRLCSGGVGMSDREPVNFL